MKRNNFRILWYIIAVALFLVAIAGLNLKLQGDHAKENKTTQSATNTKLNIALVNEDQNVSNGKESYNLGASYIKSIERDNSQNWSVVSRGTAQNGLNKGDYQLMVIIPNNFSQKLLDVNKANAEQTTISYKVNAKGNLALEKKATEKGKDIVSELNSHLVNMYMASILSNLYTAQENVQAMVNVQSGNISNYQKNLLDSATNFQNIFPALVNQSSSSITANESLKKSLEASDNMFNDLVTTQTNTGKDLSSLIEQRHQDSISYEAFSASLLEMNNELLEKQLSDIITQAQKDQETLSSQLNSIMGDDNDNDHNHKENSSAYLNVARQKIQELSEALKSQDNVAKDQSEQLDKIVREGLASYFAKNNKDNITLLELLKSHSNNEKTLKDFKAKVADFFTIDDDEKIAKFIARIKVEMSDRKKALSRYNVATAKLYRQVSGETMPQILIVIDSYEGLREAQTLTNLEACFQNISRDGSSLGISLVISAGRMAALRSSLMANLKERIALKLTDDSESRTLVGRHQHIMEDIPGRGLIKRDDIEVLQVALPTEGTETFDIISNIQTESDAMNDKWTGPRPKAIPIVPEELTFDDFMATDSVQADLSANRLPLGLEMVDVESFSLPLTKFKHLLFLSDSDEGLENLGSHLLKTLIKVPEYSTMIIDSLGEHEAYQGQVRTYVGADMISDMAEQLNYELGKRQEQNAFDRWFILIPDFESFVSKTNLSLEQIQNLLDNGPKVGLHLIIGSAFSFVGSKLDPVNKYVKTNSQYVMLGMRLMDQTFLEKVYNSKEARLERDEAYIHDRKNYQKLKLSID
ncbi:TPA: type VII secretion protein EsaA [Streptococcus agalactiae]